MTWKYAKSSEQDLGMYSQRTKTSSKPRLKDRATSVVHTAHNRGEDEETAM